jgi:hypothetical protein
MAGLLPSARGPDREVRVEKPGLPSAGLLFWCSGRSPTLYPSEIKLEVDGGDRHDEVPHLFRPALTTLLWLGILWAFAQDPRDDLAALA